MKRTTVFVDERLMEQLRQIARREQVSLATVIRQALKLRAGQDRPRLSFIGTAASVEGPFDAAARSADLPFEPGAWR